MSIDSLGELPNPPYFNPARAGDVYKVPYQERAEQAAAWASQHGIRPAAGDALKIALVLIDVQNTFCMPGFELFVAGRSGTGAVDDCRRMCEFIYRNLGSITSITATLDTHQAVQIFHPIYLVNEKGEHPAPYTLVSHADVAEGRWRFNPEVAPGLRLTPEEGQAKLLHYTRALQERGKYDLTIWPYHAMLGGIGHALVPAVEEAIFFHTIARDTPPSLVIKGRRADTENYSAIGPEVLVNPEGKTWTEKDESFIKLVIENDRVVIAGEAKSHCVAWTVEDLLNEIRAKDERLAGKVYLLEDCSSPVVIPGVVDYTDQADAAFERFEASGMHRVQSTAPISFWPETESVSKV
jgi:nicotinamidase-related amidase